MQKYALVIGINYFGTDAALSGCINDTKMIRRFLKSTGYAHKNITVLRDDKKGESGFMTLKDTLPTKITITQALASLIDTANKNAKTGCEIFFSYSGHGSYQRDTTSDETDKRDEVLVPMDYAKSGMIVDDDLRKAFSKLDKRVKVYILMDCCHSGTNVDLPFVYELTTDKKLRLRENNSVKYKEFIGKNITMISGCRDAETSADVGTIYSPDKTKISVVSENDYVDDGDTAGGALTSSVLKIWTKDTRRGMIDIYKELITPEFKNNFSQFPVLSACVELVRVRDGEIEEIETVCVAEEIIEESCTPLNSENIKPNKNFIERAINFITCGTFFG